MTLTIGKSKPTFVVDSANRLSGSTSDFSVNVPISRNHDYDSIAVDSVQIPKSWSTIDSTNNQFVLIVNAVSSLITIPVGNYNILNFPIVLKQLLDTASGLTFTITFPDWNEVSTDLFTFGVTPGNAVSFSFDTLNVLITSKHTPYDMMGFGKNSLNVFVADSLISTYPVNFQRTKFLTIKSNISNNIGNGSSDNATLVNAIPTSDAPDGSLIVYTSNNLEEATKMLRSNTTNNFQFSIYDDNNEIIDLNGRDVKITLFLYRHNNYFEASLHSLKVQHLEKIVEYEQEEQKYLDAL